jgi:hypothetical protein
MRWFVDISALPGQVERQGPAGAAAATVEPARLCVEANEWQPALRAARALRGDDAPMSGFSIELLDDGYRAVDPSARVRYLIRRAPDNAPLSQPSGKRESARPPAPTKGREVAIPLDEKPPPPPPPKGASAPAVPPLVAHEVFSHRDDAPTDEQPLRYRELVLIVAEGTPAEAVERLLREKLDELKASLASLPERKLVQLAVLERLASSGRPARRPVATLTWKDWREGAELTHYDPARARATMPPASIPPVSQLRPAVTMPPRDASDASAEVISVEPSLKVQTLPPSSRSRSASGPPPALPPSAFELDRKAVRSPAVPADLAPAAETRDPMQTQLSAQEPEPAVEPETKLKPQVVVQRAEPDEDLISTQLRPQVKVPSADAAPHELDAELPPTRVRAPEEGAGGDDELPPTRLTDSQRADRDRQAAAAARFASLETAGDEATLVRPTEVPAPSQPELETQLSPGSQEPARASSEPAMPATGAPMALATSVPASNGPNEPTTAATPAEAAALGEAPRALGLEAPIEPVRVVTIEDEPPGSASEAKTPAPSSSRAKRRGKKRESAPPPVPSAPRSATQLAGSVRVSGDELIVELFDACAELLGMTSAEQALDFAVALILDKLPCKVLLLSTFDIDKNELVVTRQQGGKDVVGHRFREEGVVRAAMRAAHAQRPTSPSELAATARWQTLAMAPTSVLLVPVVYSGRYLALFELANPHDGMPFTEADTNALQYLAEQLAEAIATRAVSSEPLELGDPFPAVGRAKRSLFRK